MNWQQLNEKRDRKENPEESREVQNDQMNRQYKENRGQTEDTSTTRQWIKM